MLSAPERFLKRRLRSLQNAIDRKRPAEVRAIVAAEPELLDWAAHGFDALAHACGNARSAGCARALLQAGAHPERPEANHPGPTPLGQAIEYLPALVPELLVAGARPRPGRTGETLWLSGDSDLARAARLCPAHVPQMLAYGADVNGGPSDGARFFGSHQPSSPLAGAFHSCLDPTQASVGWQALTALIEAGADFRHDHGEGFRTPAWFLFWNFRFQMRSRGMFGMPKNADALLDSLADRMTNPGLRHQGQTFLHAIAAALPKSGSAQNADAEWARVLARYTRADLESWAQHSNVGWSLAALPIRQTEPAADLSELAEAMERSHRYFVPLGANANDPTNRGRTAAHALAQRGWSALKDADVQLWVRRWGLDLHRPDLEGVTPIHLLDQQHGLKPSALERGALLLETTLADPSRPVPPKPRF